MCQQQLTSLQHPCQKTASTRQLPSPSNRRRSVDSRGNPLRPPHLPALVHQSVKHLLLMLALHPQTGLHSLQLRKTRAHPQNQPYPLWHQLRTHTPEKHHLLTVQLPGLLRISSEQMQLKTRAMCSTKQGIMKPPWPLMAGLSASALRQQHTMATGQLQL